MSQRIKGQETVLSFTSPEGDEDVGDIKSFEAELDIQILEEGYLGETANRFDDIYNGTSGNCEMHLENSNYFAFTQKAQDRAQRRSASDGKFSATSAFDFPDGSRVRLTFEDIFFGPMPLRAPSRGEYVAVTLSWKCSTVRRVF